MGRFSKAILLLMILTFGDALRCYYCGGYSSSLVESNTNTRDCADGSFRGSKVDTREGSGNACVKRVSINNYGERFVMRYLGYDDNGVVKRSLDAIHTTNSTNRLGPLKPELEGQTWPAEGHLSEEGDPQMLKVHDDQAGSPSNRARRDGRQNRFTNDQYYYCYKNKCNSSPRALTAYFATVLLLAATASALS